MSRGHAAGVALSLLYAREEAAGVHCSLSQASTGFEEQPFDEHLWKRRYYGRSYADVYDGEYPANSLRNLARRQIQTDPLVFLVDADMMPSDGLYEELTHGAFKWLMLQLRRDWDARKLRRSVIVPTYERTAARGAATAAGACSASQGSCWTVGGYDIPTTKAVLREMSAAGTVAPFYWSRWARGHACYEPLRWLNVSQVYEIRYKPGCEPYTIAPNGALPDFDERFRGRVADKVSHVQHMALIGFRFTVHPSSFLVHLPHPPTRFTKELVFWSPARLDQKCLQKVLLRLQAQEIVMSQRGARGGGGPQRVAKRRLSQKAVRTRKHVAQILKNMWA